MLKKHSTKLLCLLIAFLGTTIIIGSSYAYFIDNVQVNGNIITSGNLKAEMQWSDDMQAWHDVQDAETPEDDVIFSGDRWEPNYTEVKYIKIKNTGNLAFQYRLDIIPTLSPANPGYKLGEVIEAYVDEVDADYKTPTGSKDFEGRDPSGTIASMIASDTGAYYGTLLEAKEDITLAVALHMQHTAGNEYMGLSVGDGFKLRLYATQTPFEYDSFGKDYDEGAKEALPENEFAGGSASGFVNVANGETTSAVTLSGGAVQAYVPAGVKVNDGVTELTLSVTVLEESQNGIKAGKGESLLAVDVHVEGLSSDNTVPLKITLSKALAAGLNVGNTELYHVENGKKLAMAQVMSDAALDAHNQYYYNPVDGTLTLNMATFSEVAAVADTVNAWNGTVATAFGGGTGTETDPYIIANADQLAYMGGRVSNDNTNYGSKHYKLIADVNIGGIENYNTNGRKVLWYPIGYNKVGGTTTDKGNWYTYGGAFSGTFDGNGHTITGIYQNTWAMVGDYSGTYYNDAMGFFGYVNGGTVKNLTIDDFYSEGEFAPTGCVTAYAAGKATFQNIAITNSHPQTYNTGVAGIVGWDEGDASEFTFKNITVDSSNTISALWGSWDVAAAGLLGYLSPNSEANLDNCHVSATIDVYNDVCGNYQYYWYRYCGMLIGTVDKTNADGSLNLSNITATNCTVNFGDRHEYYYCEFVENTKASYTHDYQFSRVDNKDIVGSGDNATCQNHNHEEHGYETVNASSVLVEDKQAVYIPFRQLFGGYGWGVNGYDIETMPDLDISADKKGVEESEKEEAEVKFESKFTGDFLYRVGNAKNSPVELKYLFAAKVGATINSSGVYVTIDKVDENSNVSGTFTPNTTNWEKGTIQFGGTGVVKVTIQDYNFCTPTVLYLEVVDATNLTSATGTTTGGNFVLLCDVNTSNYVYYWNCNLYGNGFTYSLNGAPTNYSSSHGHGVLMTKNATLDNLVIVGDIYDEYGAYTNNNDYNAAIDVMGDTIIQNCYISGCSAPISTRANTTIKNTTLYGGAVANLLIKGGTVTLEDVTTANYNDGRNAPIGMGIVIHSDAAENTKLVLNGTLTQYNFLNEEDAPTDTYAKNLHSTMFGSSLSKYHFGKSPNRRVNTGVVSLTATFNAEDITDNANTGYSGTSVTLSGVNGYVYTQPNTSGSVNNGYDKDSDSHVSTTQGAVPPSYSFDHTVNYKAKTDGSNDYCYEENGTVYISMDEGDTFNWDTSILTLDKDLADYAVSMDDTDYTGKSITFNTAGDYKVVYTYTDPNNYKLDKNGNITTYSVTYTKTVNISVAVIKATTKHATFTMGSSNAATEKITIDNATYISATGVTADNSTWTYITIDGQKIYYPIVAAKLTSTKGSSTYAYFPVFENAVTITDYADNGTGDAFTYNSSTTTLPSTLTAVKGIYKAASDVPYWYNLTNSNLTQSGASKIFKWASSSDAPSDPTTYNNVLCYKSPQISANREAYITLVQYSYTDATNTTYYYYVGYTLEAFAKQTTCVTPDTLVTLADGSKKEIQHVTYEDQLLVWDFYKGEYVAAPAAIISNHGYGENTVIALTFSDGTVVKAVNGHAFVDLTCNDMVFIDAENAKDYVGHSFAKAAVDGYEAVTLTSYTVSTEMVEAWGVLTAGHYNCITEDIISFAGSEQELASVDYFEYGDGLKYDEAAMQADIETYGVYTYEEFAPYLSEAQFEALGIKYMTITVGKGKITHDYILELINTYVK